MGINWSLDWVKLQPELSHQKVAPTVTYRDIAIDILIDAVSKNQKVIDSATITDLFSANLIRPVFDEITLSDSVIKYVIKDYLDDVPDSAFPPLLIVNLQGPPAVSLLTVSLPLILVVPIPTFPDVLIDNLVAQLSLPSLILKLSSVITPRL